MPRLQATRMPADRLDGGWVALHYLVFVINSVLWLAALPFRLAMWLVGLIVWTVTLPLRIVWGILSLVGFGRLATLAVLGVAGYSLWRLVSDDEAPAPVAPALDPSGANAPDAAAASGPEARSVS